jgi:hypothetical protein
VGLGLDKVSVVQVGWGLAMCRAYSSERSGRVAPVRGRVSVSGFGDRRRVVGSV